MGTENSAVLGFVVLSLIVLSASTTTACGCGLALSDAKVFNALKETQAYLMIDIKDQDSYEEVPFFRMVSMEEPYNVTIVFPIDAIPYDVEGRAMPARQFLEGYRISSAENHIMKQSLSGAVKKIRADIEKSSSTVFGISNGFVGFSVLSLRSGVFGVKAGASVVGFDPLAHFEFDGGSLDIYDVNSMDTLEEFVKEINVTLSGKVQDLVTKYKDYFVAVLYLRVPSAVNEDLRNQLKLCPAQTEHVKQQLQEKTEFTSLEIRKLAEGPCSESLGQLIRSVTNVDSGVNGTMVNMKFRGTDGFFYPTTIVNSYEYPITDQKYFIKTPAKLHVKLDSSGIDGTASFDSERWYKVSSTEEDIKGKIINAGVLVRIGDIGRSANQAFYDGSHWLVALIYVLIIILPLLFYHFMAGETPASKEVWVVVGLSLVGGFLLSSLMMLIRKKKKFAFTLFFIWLLSLAMMLIF